MLLHDCRVSLVCLFCYRSIVGRCRGDEQFRLQ